MKKRTLILVCLFLIGIAKNTDAKGLTTLVVTTTDAGETTFILSERPEVTFANHTLTINVKNDDHVFEISNIEQIHFDVVDNILSPKASTISYRYLSDNLIIVEGIDSDDQIQLYSLGGMLIPNLVNHAGDRADVSLASLQKGTYLLKIGNKQVIKIYRK